MGKQAKIDHQLRQNDCGVSAVKTVCNVLDVAIPRDLIEASLPLDEVGASIGSMQQFFHKYGFDSKYHLLDIQSLNGNADEIREWVPFITPVHRDGGLHFVVVDDIRDDKFSVLDPADGQAHRWSVQEFRKNAFFSPSLLELADLEDILRVRVKEELARWQIALPAEPVAKELPVIFNKMTYFTHINDHFGFRNQAAARAFLEDLLLHQNLSHIPEHFRTLTVRREQIEMKSPLLLSVKKTGSLKFESIGGAGGDENLYLKLFRSVRPVRDIWGIFLLSTIVASLIGYLSVFINQILIDQILPSYELATLQIFAIGVGVFALVDLFFYIYKKIIGIHLSNSLDRYFLSVFDDKLNSFSIRFVQSFKRGDLTERLSDSTRLKSFFVSFVSTVFVNALTALMSLSILFFLNWQLSLVVLSVLGLFVGLFYGFTPLIRRLEQQRFTVKAAYFSKFIEKIDGLQVIRSLGLEGISSGEIRQRINEMMRIQTRASYISLANTALTTLITAGASLTILLLASREMMLDHRLSLGMIITFLGLSSRIFGSFQTLLEENLHLQENAVILRRFFDFDEKTVDGGRATADGGRATADGGRATAAANFGGAGGLSTFGQGGLAKNVAAVPSHSLVRNFKFEKLSVRGMSFAYVTDRPIFQNVNFDIRRGDRIWIQGENGAGKSTFCKVISLLYPPTGGQILLNDLDHSLYDPARLRQKVVFVGAEDLLFNESLLYNIAFGRPIDMEKLVDYATAIRFYDFINEQPEKFNFTVFEGGKNLSTGQRKKLLLLRALMSDADLIILDEIFNGMDHESRKNTEFLLQFLAEKTFLLISHMPIEGIRFDKKYALNHGKMVEI